MPTEYWYFSLQYSAIQKTVLRHDRLWSIAGISNILSRLNELDMPDLVAGHAGTVIVAGGGKLTARFTTESNAKAALDGCVGMLSTNLPMLEFQVSSIRRGLTFKSLVEGERNILLDELSAQKRAYRGYGVSFNPHLKLCDECGEYPAQDPPRELTRDGRKTVVNVCRVCRNASDESKAIYSEQNERTNTLQQVYHRYRREVPDACGREPVADFADLFPKKDGGTEEEQRRNRMAVWFSDLNNMNDKVPVWLNQADENEVRATFKRFSETVIDIVAGALVKTFGKLPRGGFLPFRLVVAGGDDLCLVMAEKDILAFAHHLSKELNGVWSQLPPDHPLTVGGLRKLSGDPGYNPKPFGFGGSFVVTSVHTPFSQIHRVGDELMSASKKVTDRQGNSVNWRIMAEEESVTDQFLRFERPLFIEAGQHGVGTLDQLSLNEYLAARKRYCGELSNSQMFQLLAIMQSEPDPWKADRRMKLLDSSEADKKFSKLLRDDRFRDANGMLLTGRLATLFELLSIEGDTP
jgi:hypothetical protein